MSGAPASDSACLSGETMRSRRSEVSSFSFARPSFISRCFGPVWSAVMNGRLIWVSCVVESSIFAFSAASYSRWREFLSADRSIP